MVRFNLWIKKILGERSKVLLCRCLYPFRNKFILFNIFNGAKDGEVNLNYWSESKNLGDYIAPMIVEHLMNEGGVSEASKSKKTEHLFAVGSVITAGIQDGTVWGSGILNPKLLYRLKGRKLDVRSVRGPITRALLMDNGFDVPEIYGDPGIFLPEIYNPQVAEKKAKYGIIMHKDYELTQQDMKDLDNYLMIDIKTDDVNDFIENIKSVEMVIASSLHGIILAEAYGIPALLYKPKVDFMKYYDYYFSTNRTNIPMITSFSEINDVEVLEVPEFTTMKENLRKAFPYDLYARKKV